MLQLDMFAAPAKAAVDVQPNGCGVYPDQEAEVLHLKVSAYCDATIRLMHLPIGWIEATSYSMQDCGGGGPLMTHRVYPDRTTALEKAKADLWGRTELRHGASATFAKQSASIRAWLESLA